MSVSRCEEATQDEVWVNASHASEPSKPKEVLFFLCVFCTCRAFVVPAEVFHTWCLHADFSRAPVFVSLRALEVLSAQFLPLILM